MSTIASRILAICGLRAAGLVLAHALVMTRMTYMKLGASSLLLPVLLAISCSSDDAAKPGPKQVQCAAGTATCGDDCVDTSSDALHCGSCSTKCSVGQSCAGGECACQASLTACGQACVDLASSGSNCGACGNACKASEVCSNQSCGSSCGAGETACGQDCVDLDTSVTHCGACGAACPTGQICQSGACQCDGAGQTLCAGECVVTDTDPANCGACGNACGTSELCEAGQCIATGSGGSGGGGTGGGANGGSGGAGTGGGGTGGSTGGAGGGTTGLLDPSRVTLWKPGVAGGVPDSSGFTVHTTVTLGSNAGTNRSNIQNAINAAGAVATAQSPRVVALPAGSYHINARINLNQNYVVLRGAGPNVGGTGGGTRLIMDAVDTDMFFMGNYTDWGSPKHLAADAAKGASTFTLAAGHGVQSGDLLVIDRLDDANVTLQGGTWWKRGPGNSDNGPQSSGGYRSMGQVVEVTGVSGNVITIAGVLHHDYPVATFASQVFGSSDRRAGWIGIGLENMTITGWGDAMGVYANWLKNCWIKRVEFDGQPTSQGGFGTGTRGNDTRIFRSVRFTIAGSYLHHSRVYQTNNNAYSISLAAQTSDSLVEDNIVWFKNKNVVLEASGAGNVVAYNYVEDPVIADSGANVRTDWMEMCMDGSHLSHPSMDLFEGNYVSKMGAAETHGNAGDQTFLRNYSKGNRLHTISDSASVAAVMLNRYMRRMNFLGNVLTVKGAGSNAIYAPTFDASGNMPWSQVHTPKIWSLGLDGYDGNWQGPRDPGVEQELVRVYNYDYVTNQVDSQPAAPLPDSLYLGGKPAFFGANAWPWVNPLGTSAADRVKTLPAQARFANGTFL